MTTPLLIVEDDPEITSALIRGLRLLVAHGTAPLPRHAIFEALWAAEGSASENVVDVYIGYLRKKLTEGDFGFEIRTIRNQGFVVEGLAAQTATP
jgi:DNA-binding response OmpR family regulator